MRAPLYHGQTPQELLDYAKELSKQMKRFEESDAAGVCTRVLFVRVRAARAARACVRACARA